MISGDDDWLKNSSKTKINKYKYEDDDDNDDEDEDDYECDKDYDYGKHLKAESGDVLKNKYRLEKKLGRGYFSTVWSAKRLAKGLSMHLNNDEKKVAIKISKSDYSFQVAAKDECAALKMLKNYPFFLRLTDKFVVQNPRDKTHHFCLVFEKMEEDLYSFMKKFRQKKGMPLNILKIVCYQVICGLEILEERKMIHTDLKPDNFLIQKNVSLDEEKKNLLLVKMADFGNVYFHEKQQFITFNLTTRPYRSPEIILGYPFGPGIDIFSCGVMFFEMATCRHLFFEFGENNETNKNVKQLQNMIRLLGPMPIKMIKEGKYGKFYFNRLCEIKNQNNYKNKQIGDIYGYLKENASLEKEIDQFFDVLMHMLDLDPLKRWDAKRLKTHEWFEKIDKLYQEKGINSFCV